MSQTTIGAEVPVATANGYIQQYIEDYYTPGIMPVKSLIFDAELLRSYLTNTNIQNIKFMLGVRPFGTGETITLVIAGYDESGNYILTPSGNVLDNTYPCPTQCPTTGNASNDYITT